MTDTVNLFADAHRVRAKRDECGETIIPGRIGHIYEHGADKFGVYLFLAASGNGRRRRRSSELRASRSGKTLRWKGRRSSIRIMNGMPSSP